MVIMKIINKKLVAVGNSYDIRIPKAYVDNGVVNPDKAYDFIITAVERTNKEVIDDEQLEHNVEDMP